MASPSIGIDNTFIMSMHCLYSRAYYIDHSCLFAFYQEEEETPFNGKQHTNRICGNRTEHGVYKEINGYLTFFVVVVVPSLPSTTRIVNIFFFSSFCLASMTFANKRTSEWSIFQRVRESMCCVVSNVYCYMQSSRETYEEINKRKRGDTRLRTTTNGMNVINRPRSHKLNDKNIITKNGQIQEIRWDNKRTTQREGERSTECLQDRTTQQQQQKQRQTPRATNRRTEIEDETEWGVKKKTALTRVDNGNR